jgi:hypothetical protein
MPHLGSCHPERPRDSPLRARTYYTHTHHSVAPQWVYRNRIGSIRGDSSVRSCIDRVWYEASTCVKVRSKVRTSVCYLSMGVSVKFHTTAFKCTSTANSCTLCVVLTCVKTYESDVMEICLCGNRDCSVGIVNRLWGGQPTNCSSIPGMGRGFLSSQNRPDWKWSHRWVPAGVFLGCKAAGQQS